MAGKTRAKARASRHLVHREDEAEAEAESEALHFDLYTPDRRCFSPCNAHLMSRHRHVPSAAEMRPERWTMQSVCGAGAAEWRATRGSEVCVLTTYSRGRGDCWSRLLAHETAMPLRRKKDDIVQLSSLDLLSRPASRLVPVHATPCQPRGQVLEMQLGSVTAGFWKVLGPDPASLGTGQVGLRPFEMKRRAASELAGPGSALSARMSPRGWLSGRDAEDGRRRPGCEESAKFKAHFAEMRTGSGTSQPLALPAVRLNHATTTGSFGRPCLG